jgi:5-formyltetrahydrofolate cyclo-ligase
MLSQKQAIRKNILMLREQLPLDARTDYSAAIGARIVQLDAYRQAGTILGYMNFGTEVASELWIGQILAEGKRLVLPKVNHHTNRLDLYYVEDFENQLAPGLWGIREPVAGHCERLRELDEIEFALLPGVAFARDGARLGYGKGFYDKLLAQMMHRPVLAAAAFSLQIVERLPQETTDIKVECIITEQEIIECPKPG